MSTPDQPDTPALTRKQLRVLRDTAATPIISVSDEDEDADDDAGAAGVAAPAPVAAVATPLPRPADPAVVAPVPEPDESVDLDATPLTRRQARQQERLRTASVPVITPEMAAAHLASLPAVDTDDGPSPDAARHPEVLLTQTAQPMPDDMPHIEALVTDDADDEHDRLVIDPSFGASLLDDEPVAASMPSSFDQLIARDASSTGSVSTPHALILSQTPSSGPMLAPIASTGEVLITGTLSLPEGLGSLGHAPGAADGREADAVLIDGELPAHSSPTPIAASAAISTIKGNDEIIRPPAPEKGSRLMMALIITAGALALALLGVLIVALATGVFS